MRSTMRAWALHALAATLIAAVIPTTASAYSPLWYEEPIELKEIDRGRDLLARHEFDKLEELATRFRDPKLADQRGYSYSIQFYERLWKDISKIEFNQRIDGAWERARKKWIALYPASPAPHLAHAAKLLRQAALYRGIETIDQVEDGDLEKAVELWGEAYDYLMARPSHGLHDYAWYYFTFNVEAMLGVDRGMAYARLVDGITRYPQVRGLYISGANFLLPKWGGSWHEFNAWVELAVKNTRQRHGLAQYALIYGVLGSDLELYHQAIHNPRHWSLLQAGFKDLETHYPNLDVTIEAMNIGCGARDETFSRYWTEQFYKAKNLTNHIGHAPRDMATMCYHGGPPPPVTGGRLPMPNIPD